MPNNSYTLARHEGGESAYMIAIGENGPYIAHSGTKGMKWGQRLYQYLSGALTPLGREHYGVGPPRGSGSETKDAVLKKSGNDIRIGKDGPKQISVNSKNGKNITINGKDASAVKSGIQARIKEIQDKRRENALNRAEIKENARKEKEAKKEAEKLAKEAKEEAERKAQEEAEADHERAKVEALKEYYREHPLQIYSARNLLSEEDIKDVQKKIEMDRKLKDFRRDELMRYVRTANDVVNTLDTAVKAGKDLKDLYNLGAETYNALVAAKDPNDDKKPMRIIGKTTLKPKNGNSENADQNSAEENQGEQNQNGNSGKKSSKKQEKKQNSAQNVAAETQKEMGEVAKKSSTNEKAEAVKKDYENLAKEVNSNKSSDKPKYVDKVTTPSGETRYFYDKEQKKAYDQNRKWGIETARKIINKSNDKDIEKFRKDLDEIRDLKTKDGSWSSSMEGKYDRLIDELANHRAVLDALEGDWSFK